MFHRKKEKKKDGYEMCKMCNIRGYKGKTVNSEKIVMEEVFLKKKMKNL